MTKNQPIKIIELFAGIGAFRKALEQLVNAVKVLFISEINASAELAYQSIFSDKPENLGDIKKSNSWDLSSYQDCDFLFIGSPCQDFSIAGFNRGGSTLIPVLV